MRSRSSPTTGSGTRGPPGARSAALARNGYQAVTLGRVWRAWGGEASLPRRPVVLTFDDGYLSQYRTAAQDAARARLAGRAEPPGRPPRPSGAASLVRRCAG